MTITRSLLKTYRTLVSRILGTVLMVYVLVAAPPRVVPGWVAEIGELVGFVLLVIASFGRVWCLMFIADKKSKTLTTEGPYSVVRNPLYVFSFIGAVGLGLAFENPLLAGLLAVVFAVCYPWTVAYEEERLRSLFGEEYTSYCSTTPRWFPNWRRFHQPQSLSVCPAIVTRGMIDAMWFLWLFLAWETIEFLRETGMIQTLI